MKWEILKGSENDFEGAPGWSMVVLYNNIACGKVFAEGLKIGRKRTSLIGCGDSVIVAEHEWDVIAERRPITEPVWDGEGVPPAGVECEYELYAGEWRKCRIEFVGRELMIVSTGGSEFSCNFYAKFRPIRSPLDVEKG